MDSNSLLSPDLVELIHDAVLNPNELARRARDKLLEGALRVSIDLMSPDVTARRASSSIH